MLHNEDWKLNVLSEKVAERCRSVRSSLMVNFENGHIGPIRIPSPRLKEVQLIETKAAVISLMHTTDGKMLINYILDRRSEMTSHVSFRTHFFCNLKI